MTATLFAPTGTAPLSVTAAATATNVGRLRRTVRDWLSHALDDEPDVASDLTLAAGEALENAVDHAFAGTDAVGSMWVRASDEGHSVSVVVGDDGTWQQPTSGPGYRRRGIDLMGRLSDATSIEPGPGGTSVTLVHHRTS